MFCFVLIGNLLGSRGFIYLILGKVQQSPHMSTASAHPSLSTAFLSTSQVFVFKSVSLSSGYFGAGN